MILRIIDAILMVTIATAYICLILAPFLVDDTPKPKRENQ